MAKHELGAFEEIVMLTVGVLYGNAYGVTIRKEIEDRLQRRVSVGALQSALKRLEQKRFLEAREGETSPERGGRPKRYFTITAQGKQALDAAMNTRQQLYKAIPDLAWNNLIAG